MLAALAYSTAEALVRALPPPWAEGAARGVARTLYAARVPARLRLERNLERIGARDRRAVGRCARDTFEQFALAVTDFLRLRHASGPALRDRVVVRGAEHLDAARRSGRGCIVLSVHSGCWEWGAAFLAHRGVPLRILARPHASASVERYFWRRRAAWGLEPLDRAPCWLEAARALRGGAWVALMGDRAVPGLGGSLGAWASALARRTGAVVLPVAMTRGEDGRHTLWCDPPLAERPGLEPAVREALHRQLERARGQWFAFAPLSEELAWMPPAVVPARA
jgi:KDO2-lipid IV(A) lauroyltransferase